MNKYKVYLHTKGGFYAQYDGNVEVDANDEESAKEKALDELKRTSFPDYGRDWWQIDEVKKI